MSENEWTPADAAQIQVGDQTLIEGKWQTITAVGSSSDAIVIYVGGERIVYPADAKVMVRTGEDREAIVRRQRELAAAWEKRLSDASEPWYLKLLNRIVK